MSFVTRTIVYSQEMVTSTRKRQIDDCNIVNMTMRSYVHLTRPTYIHVMYKNV